MNQDYLRNRIVALENEVEVLKKELQNERKLRATDNLESERQMLEVLVEERKKTRQMSEELESCQEKLKMTSEACEALFHKSMTLEVQLFQVNETNERNALFLEQLAAQKAADEHVKKAMDEETRSLRHSLRILRDENGYLHAQRESST
jgi:uncharacterized small protein (DUF1192 family)